MATSIARAYSGKIPRLSSLPKTPFRSQKTKVSESEHLVRARCKSGNLSLEEALGHFNSLIGLRPLPSVWIFNRLFGSVYDTTNYSFVVSMYRVLMGFADFRPEVSTLNYVVNCYCRLRRVDLGFSVYATVVKLGLHWDVHTLSIILHELCSQGSMAAAMRLFEELTEREHPGHEFSYAIVINGLCKAGEGSAAFELLKRMYHGRRVMPDSGCFSPVINRFFGEGRAEEALGLFDVMTSLDVSPDPATCNSLVRGLCRFGRWVEADGLLADMHFRYGFSPNLRTYNILIDCLCKGERTDGAVSLFNLIVADGKRPNVVTFNSLFSGLSRRGRWDQVSELSKIMDGFGVSPDQSTFAPMVDALCKEGRVGRAISLVDEMSRRGLAPNTVIYNSIIHGLCLSGQWREGIRVLDRMNDEAVQPCSFTFHILVTALCKQRMFKEALKLLKCMIERGLVPDNRLRTTLMAILARFPKHVK